MAEQAAEQDETSDLDPDGTVENGLEAPPGSTPQSTPETWAEVLATMEQAVRMADHGERAPALTMSEIGWQLPSGLGPLPEQLRSRAERILRAQDASMAVLEEKLRVTARHIAALEIIPSKSRRNSTAAYLDVIG